MLRDNKYKPRQLQTYCPACGQLIEQEEWNDYGMHLHCTEYYASKQYIQDQQPDKHQFNSVLIGAMDF